MVSQQQWGCYQLLRTSNRVCHPLDYSVPPIAFSMVLELLSSAPKTILDHVASERGNFQTAFSTVIELLPVKLDNQHRHLPAEMHRLSDRSLGTGGASIGGPLFISRYYGERNIAFGTLLSQRLLCYYLGSPTLIVVYSPLRESKCSAALSAIHGLPFRAFISYLCYVAVEIDHL